MSIVSLTPTRIDELYQYFLNFRNLCDEIFRNEIDNEKNPELLFMCGEMLDLKLKEPISGIRLGTYGETEFSGYKIRVDGEVLSLNLNPFKIEGGIEFFIYSIKGDGYFISKKDDKIIEVGGYLGNGVNPPLYIRVYEGYIDVISLRGSKIEQI